MENMGLIIALGGVCLSLLGYLAKSAWEGLKSDILNISNELKAIRGKVTDLEKVDVGVQYHLESLKDLKLQIDSVRSSVTALLTFTGKDDD